MSQASSNDDSQSNQPEVVPLDPFWLTRWISLRTSIEGVSKECSRDKTLEQFMPLLEALRSFGANHFYYFFLGFGGSINNGILSNIVEDEYTNQLKFFEKFLEKSSGTTPLKSEKQCPPNYVMRSIIDQISRDFDSIQRAIRQRQFANDSESLTLQLADKWGHSILEGISGEDANKPLKERATVITYFNSSPRINIIPYANVALIGIPYTANLADGRRDLLVIPHELGHYVFHFGKVNSTPLKEDINKILNDDNQGNKQNSVILNWAEEIFADVFGIYSSHQVGIVTFALSMIADNLPSQTYLDRGIHPIDALRIKIYLNTIEKIEEELRSSQTNASLPELRLLSQQIRAHIENEKHVIRTRESIHPEIPEDFVAKLDVLVEKILKAILPFIGIENWKPVIAKLAKQANIQRPIEQKLENLYENFEAYLWDLSKNMEPSYKIESYANRYELIKVEITKLPVCYDEWKPIFEADGWAIRGPETQPVGGWEGGSFVPNIAIIHP